MDKHFKKQKPLTQAISPLFGKAFISKGEKLIREFFSYYYPKEKVYYNYRPDWLEHKKTGKNLELDIYYPKLKLAIEFQGIHHQLKYQLEKDEIKKGICRELKIRLIVVYHPHYLFKLRKKLRLKSLPKKLKRKIGKYKKGKPSKKIGRYISYVSWKLKKEKRGDVQKIESDKNKEREVAKEKIRKEIEKL